MKIEDLVGLLTDYGLSSQEAVAYYHLCKRGEATASELAKASGLSRGDVYRAVDALEQNGLLQRTMDRPQRFIPVGIDEGVERLVEKERRRVARLEEGRETLVTHWPTPGEVASEEEMRFHVRQGRAMIEGEFRRMVERAVREVCLAAPHRTVNRLLTWGLGPVLEEAAARGVRVRVLTQLTPSLLGDGSGLPRSCERRHSEVPVYAQFLIVDQREIAAYVTADAVLGTTGRPETILWLNSPDYAMGQQALFDDLWDESIDEETRLTELETGHLPNAVHAVRGRLPRIDRLRQLVKDAERSLSLAIDAPVAKAAARLRLGERLAEKAAEGVEVRLLIAPEVEDTSAFDAVPWRRGALGERLAGCIRDDTEALVTAVLAESDPKEDRTVVLTVPAALATLGARFDAAWSAASTVVGPRSARPGKRAR